MVSTVRWEGQIVTIEWRRVLSSAVGLGLAAVTFTGAHGQEAAKPAAQGNDLPEVTVEQKKPKAASKTTAAKKKAPAQQPAPVEAAQPAATPEYAVPDAPGNIAVSPLPGSEMPIAKIPRAVTSLSAADIQRDHSVIAQDFLNNRVPGVTVDDLQGNAFQTGVQYRGFEASPVNGLPQGLAVYQNGVRINEAFGDTVNWDFLPTNAINDLAVRGSNPVFGLNAIGGALSLTMKDGFSYQGADVDTRFGSFGRKQVSTEAGMKSGGFAIYGAFEGIDDDGFRDFSDAEIRRGYRRSGREERDLANSTSISPAPTNHVGVTAAVPPELLAFGRERTFTSPQTTENEMQMYSINGAVKATPTLTFSGVTYYRHFKQSHDDGNIAEFDECGGGVGGYARRMVRRSSPSAIRASTSMSMISRISGHSAPSTAPRRMPRATAGRSRRPTSRSCSALAIHSSSAPAMTTARSPTRPRASSGPSCRSSLLTAPARS